MTPGHVVDPAWVTAYDKRHAEKAKPRLFKLGSDPLTCIQNAFDTALEAAIPSGSTPAKVKAKAALAGLIANAATTGVELGSSNKWHATGLPEECTTGQREFIEAVVNLCEQVLEAVNDTHPENAPELDYKNIYIKLAGKLTGPMHDFRLCIDTVIGNALGERDSDRRPLRLGDQLAADLAVVKKETDNVKLSPDEILEHIQALDLFDRERLLAKLLP